MSPIKSHVYRNDYVGIELNQTIYKDEKEKVDRFIRYNDIFHIFCVLIFGAIVKSLRKYDFYPNVYHLFFPF